MLVADFDAGLGHAFADAAVLEEILFEVAELLVEEEVSLVDEADGDVGDCFGGASFDVGPIGLIGRIGPIAQSADKERFFGVFGPKLEVADS